MKRIVSMIAALLFLILPLACSGEAAEPAAASPSPAPAPSDASPVPAGSISPAIEQSGIWSLADRYASTYTTMYYTVSYQSSDGLVLLKVNRSKKDTGSSRSVRDSRTVDDIVYALCDEKYKDTGSVTYSYYEAYTGRFKYWIGNESAGFAIEDHLSMDEAIALMASPLQSCGDLVFADAEWSLYFRPAGCNIEIVVLPSDNGAAIASLGSEFSAQPTDGETLYVSQNGFEIAYTDGTNSVRIRQLNHSGETAENYLTLSECKAILALLESN